MLVNLHVGAYFYAVPTHRYSPQTLFDKKIRILHECTIYQLKVHFLNLVYKLFCRNKGITFEKRLKNNQQLIQFETQQASNHWKACTEANLCTLKSHVIKRILVWLSFYYKHLWNSSRRCNKTRQTIAY